MSTADAAYADPKDAFAKFAAAYDDFMCKGKGVANPPLILKASCRNNACTEPSKRRVGGGFYNDGGTLTNPQASLWGCSQPQVSSLSEVF